MPRFSSHNAINTSPLSFQRPAIFRAMLVILFFSPIGSLGCVGEPMSTGGSFCPVGEPMGTDLLSRISLQFPT
jgi:hypothetical protein